MKLVLCDKNAHIVNLCSDVEGLETICGDIFEQKFNVLISPGNSFAFMNGNFDAVVSEKLGWHIQKYFQETWIKNCEFIPVGGAIEYWINKEKLLIYAPTMMVPMDIRFTWNVYLAMKVGLRYAEKSGLSRVIFPAFGCGCGNVSPISYKKQLQAAINDYKIQRRFNNWQEAQAYFFSLIGDS